MIYYSKITTKNKKTFAEDVFIKNKISLKCVVFDENNVTKSKDSIFNKVKNKALKEKEITIDTIKSIGKDNREIAKELK